MGDKLNFKTMTHQYFYENYILIDGKKPVPLSEFEKQVLQAYDTLKDGEQLFWFKARGGRYKLLKCVEEKAIKSLNDSK